MNKPLIIAAFFISLWAFSEVCVNNDNCPDGMICRSDLTMRGECVPENAFPTTTGKVGEPCSFAPDCQDGLICARPKGYLQAYGSCQRDLSNQRKE